MARRTDAPGDHAPTRDDRALIVSVDRAGRFLGARDAGSRHTFLEVASAGFDDAAGTRKVLSTALARATRALVVATLGERDVSALLKFVGAAAPKSACHKGLLIVPRTPFAASNRRDLFEAELVQLRGGYDLAVLTPAESLLGGSAHQELKVVEVDAAFDRARRRVVDGLLDALRPPIDEDHAPFAEGHLFSRIGVGTDSLGTVEEGTRSALEMLERAGPACQTAAVILQLVQTPHVRYADIQRAMGLLERRYPKAPLIVSCRNVHGAATAFAAVTVLVGAEPPAAELAAPAPGTRPEHVEPGAEDAWTSFWKAVLARIGYDARKEKTTVEALLKQVGVSKTALYRLAKFGRSAPVSGAVVLEITTGLALDTGVFNAWALGRPPPVLPVAPPD